MAKTSTLGSPGIEIREIDNSTRVTTTTSGAAFITGYSSQGPVEEVNAISTMDDFKNIYGAPTNAAERTFYNGVKAFVNGVGNGYTLYTSRLPYGSGMGDNVSTAYTLLAYPAIPITSDKATIGTKFSTSGQTYLVGAPACYQISASEYESIMTGELSWADAPYTNSTFALGPISGKTDINQKYPNLGNAAFIVINKSRSSVNEQFEGFYIGLSDNAFITPYDEEKCFVYNAVEKLNITTSTAAEKAITTFGELNQSRCSFKLSGNQTGSVSRVLERSITTMDISGTDFDDTLSIALIKLTRPATDSETLKLSYSFREAFNGAFGKKRVKSTSQSTVPVSYFIEDIVSDSSNNIDFLVNPYISNNVVIDSNDKLQGKIRIYGDKLINGLDYYTKFLSKSSATDASTRLAAIQKQAGVIFKTWDTEKLELVDTALYTTLKSDDYTFFKQLDSIIPFGVYTTVTNSNKIIGNVPYKVERALQLVENDEEYPDMDLIIDCGLSTIYPYSYDKDMDKISKNTYSSPTEGICKNTIYDDTVIFTGVEDLRSGSDEATCQAKKVLDAYNAVKNTFLSFCNSQANGGRGDSFFLGDILRGILIKGKDTKVSSLYGKPLTNNHYTASDGVNHSWSTSIYYPIKHLTDDFTSTYASVYAQWGAIMDDTSSQKIWMPISPYIAAMMAATDINQGPWYAAAGLNRGIIQSLIDIAVNPTQSQRTDLYKICINSVPKIPNAGIAIWGIRTMSKKDSAFDQNTCRRTFLYMEKRIKRYLRYYLFEPNTTYTRLCIYNDIKPFLDGVQTAGGIYSYTLTCDSTNNTAEIINNGDMAVDIAAAPTRSSENIIATFTVNKYSGSTTVS